MFILREGVMVVVGGVVVEGVGDVIRGDGVGEIVLHGGRMFRIVRGHGGGFRRAGQLTSTDQKGGGGKDKGRVSISNTQCGLQSAAIDTWTAFL